METQSDLIDLRPQRTFSLDRERPDPVLWVRRVDIVKDLSGDEDSVIRSILLRRGLNVLWAKPENPDLPTELFRSGVSGHASGKTTFCRILRHILGERYFSNESVRQLIRDRFPQGWIVGEVVVDGTHWLVKRPIGVGRQSFAARNANFEALHDPNLEWENYQVFLDAVSDAAMAGYPVSHFASSRSQISWQNVLPWLSRDQECRYAKLVEWRDPSSQSDAPNPSDDDRAYLVRVVLNMLSEGEQEQLSKLAQLHVERDTAETSVPKLEFEAQSLHASLIEEYGESDIPSLGDSLFLDEIIRRLNAEKETINQQFSKLLDGSAFQEAQKRHTRSIEVRSKAESHLQTLKEKLARTESALEIAQHNPSQQDRVEYYGSIPESGGVCSVSLQAAADAGCQIAQIKLKNSIDFQNRSLEHSAKTSSENLEESIANQKEEIQKAAAALTAAEEAEKECERAIQAHAEQQNAALQIQKRATERISKLEWIAHRARSVHDAAQKMRERISTVTAEIEETKKKAEAIRDGFKRSMADFSGTFNRVIGAVIGEDVTAGASFHGRAVQVSLTCRGEFTSAAIETIKILAFDLAVLLSSIEGRGFHPRFLIHDGPREADMSAAIYRRFFMLAHEFEKAAGKSEPNFQYIITTTEPPPDEIRREPWLLEPVLDASSREGRLLRVDL